MKKTNKEKLIKKLIKISHLEEKENFLVSYLQGVNIELEKNKKLLKNNEAEYEKLIATSIANFEFYPNNQIDRIMDNLDNYPKMIKNLEKLRNRTFKKYQAVENKLNKLRNSR